MRNPIALAIPFFFLFIGLEILYARWTGRRVYRLNDAFSDLGCGITQQVLNVLYGGALGTVYILVYDRYRLFDLAPLTGWIVAFLGVDFLYYWWHRASHRVRIFWAAHVVHHQSEDMNLAVALRQAPATNFTILVFYLPLMFVGVEPFQLLIAASLNTLYQFWIHSELIPKLGPLEWVLNTPSHHRAHHGVNPIYIDTNYGGTLIVWDRLFGTFVEESEPVVYGTVTPLASFDPLWAQVHPWVELARGSFGAPRWLDKARIWFMPPEWSPAGVPPHAPPGPVSPETRPKWDVPLSGAVAFVVVSVLALTVSGTFLLLHEGHALTQETKALAAGTIFGALAASAALIRRSGRARAGSPGL
ncbi:MAG: sterol desaturase family protein [Planctomycetota bacterium]